jgi:murein DD-endopeptidase MepM/ murein hydrolase activator NlpD
VWSLVIFLSLLGPAGADGSIGAVGCLLPPVVAPVVDPFREPGCEWCPGNRGQQYGAVPGSAVRAAAAGTVSFSGVVAGTRYVVVDHVIGGLRATYGGLADTGLAAGEVVAAGALVGHAGADGLHFGLRRGEHYVDPAPFIGRLVERARLVPTDGTARRPAPPPRLRCVGVAALSAMPADAVVIR